MRYTTWRRARLLLLTTLALALASLAPAPTAHGAPPLTLPAGFVDEPVVTGLRSPRAWVWTPDGRILIAEGGKESSSDINFASVRVFKGGALLSTRAVSFDVCGDGERGFLGLALDPDFATNGYLYTYYTRQGTVSTCGYNQGAIGPRNRVSRWTMVGDTIDPATEKVLIDNIPSNGGIHNAGDLRFGADGNLYISAGEGSGPVSPARDITSLGGKILRIRPDPAAPEGFTIPAGNPYAARAGAQLCGQTPPPPAGACREVFAIGFRNPFRMTIEPGTSTPYTFDVGGGAWEEINRVVAGGDYGYPDVEGPCQLQSCSGPEGTYVDPTFAYPHTGGGTTSDDAAVIGGAFYTGSSYPAQYAGNLFYDDFVRGWIRRLVPDGQGGWSDQPFATGGDSLIGLRAGPDTDIYYLHFGIDATSEIHRIRYEPGANQPPTADISASPTNGPVGTVFTFSGAGSSDPEGAPLSYSWDFGDGSSRITSTAVVTKTYASAGARTVTLTVIDGGAPPAASTPVSVKVFPGNSPPSGEIVLQNLTDPARSALYRAGDQWSFAAANLSDDQTPTGAISVTWTITFQHREHNHPFISGLAGSSGTMQIPTSGEYEPFVWYRLTMSLTDAQGQTVQVVRDLRPERALVSIASDPAGAALEVDSNPIVATAVVSRVVGFQMRVTPPAQHTFGGVTLGFAGWGDGVSARERVIAVPPGGASFVAKYRAPNSVFLPVVAR